MQPIQYSLILNIVAILVIGALAAFFNQPLLVIAVLFALVTQTHAIQRFPDDEDDDDDDEDEEQPMGFTAKLKD